VPNFGEFAAPERVIALATLANQRGWDGFFLWDHALGLPPFELEVADPWMLLAAIAPATAARPGGADQALMRIGTLVTPLARRKPAEFARQVATLDHISGGRVTFGVGLGGPEAELSALGEATSERVRVALLQESLSIMRALWDGKVVDAGGPFNYRGLRQAMLPLQEPVPIWGGGYWSGKSGTKLLARTARLQGAVLLALDTVHIREEDGTLRAYGNPRSLSVDEFERLARELGRLRRQAGLGDEYDLAVWNDSDDADRDEYGRFGATWWIEAPRRGQAPERAFDAMRSLLESGPPP
jgi:alkanesulfonate monooxygenase SsuD/methylene tetrahydromethanopterin reductase-like flavin-dependent oxidoreductase (luciferase family)